MDGRMDELNIALGAPIAQLPIGAGMRIIPASRDHRVRILPCRPNSGDPIDQSHTLDPILKPIFS